MSTAQIVAQLSAASQKLDEIEQRVRAAVEETNAARGLVASALEGGSGQLTGMFDRIREALGQASSVTGVTKEHVQATIAKAQALGN
ncbi:DUF6244 family protein [Micromonospora sp. NPDC050417]|uniref:DUF6244 family protein n=1 Tax=Micromonospora sp. NPDC050417 TaxID=3364280 RepID=UPI0037BB3FE1